MADRKNYTVLVPYPKGGGHWTRKGDKIDLLEVEALALRQAGRIKLTAELEAEQAASATTKKTAAKD
ncbi:hypothetical protein ACLBVT_23695 [Pseudomonas aeruginosa]|uniref:hypothetical protein n=1 Tax=Pseudomonas aeruginosa TaxID=287 RepID=UPI00053D853D|nr:hypothetical protein [Pseudomonas aeruginosa]EKU7686410.1 hypothetical protein [Pseudomonas aeruginosa]EKZ3179262.1 hypothetical protein [Pseudomonas aeruginosa]KSB98784.1 hypothetical protein AO879_16590 [Pseudomonas aeruginosa]KSK43166.1 hypothetical protein APA41_15895 [Pseudomonas aeruginosa]MCC0290173.1 hypothetical protein [Pseudomonas aeruginosa]